MSHSGSIRWQEVEADRYERLRLISWWDQAALSALRVVVVGCGALGSEAVKLLALAGVGRIVVVDPDRIEKHNLTRGVFFRPGDIGKYKARVTARRAMQLNTDIHVEPIVGRIETHVGLGFLRDMDIVVSCVDNMGARVAISSMCYRVSVPWVDGGIGPEAGAVMAFGASKPPCYACTMSDEMWQRLAERHTCRGFIAPGGQRAEATTAASASVIAAFQIHQVIVRAMAHRGAPGCLEDGQRALIQLSPASMSVYSVRPLHGCMFHETWEAGVRLPQGPDALTPEALFMACGCPGGTLELDRELLVEVVFQCCGGRRPGGQVLGTYTEDILVCPGCGQRTGQPVTVTAIGSDDPLYRCNLAKMGIPPRDILRVRGGDTDVFVEIGPAGLPAW